MRAMVAIEEPDGSVRVFVLEQMIDVRVEHTSSDSGMFYRDPRAFAPRWVETAVTLRGVGGMTHYDRPPAWFGEPERMPEEPALPAPPLAIERPR